MESRDTVNISEFGKHLFWNYKQGAVLDKSIVIENVLLYGELEDYRKLIKLVSKDDIRKVTDQIEMKDRFKKRINFIRRVVLSE